MANRASSAALSAAANALAAAEAARKARASVVPAPTIEPPAPSQATAVTQVLTASDRENPDKLAGADLRALAHRRGIARSEAANMSDDKLRMQLRYITNRQYADEDA